MALLGMGANVQCDSYFPGCYSIRDLILGAEGSRWTLCNDNNELNRGPYQNGSQSTLSSNHLFGYSKEVLRQTMIKHEAIFNDQIHELHRLYHRQRALMSEIKRNEFYKHKSRLEASSSASTFPRTSSESHQRFSSPILPWLNTGCSHKSVAYVEKIQSPFSVVQQKSQHMCTSAPSKACTTDLKFLESKYRKVGKKILDLELPAAEYMDSEEGESLEGENVSEVPELPFSRTSQVVSDNDYKPSLGSRDKNYSFHNDSSTRKSSAEISKGLADLNEPIEIEDKADPKLDHMVAPSSHKNTHCHDQPNRMSGFHISFQGGIDYSSTRQNLEACLDDPPSENQVKEHEILSSTFNAGSNLDSLFKILNSEKESCSSESLPEELKQTYELPSLHSWSQKSMSAQRTSEFLNSDGTQCPLSNGSLGPGSSSSLFIPCPVVASADTVDLGTLSVATWKKPVGNSGQCPIAFQVLPCSRSSAPSSRSSEQSGIAEDKFNQYKTIKSSSNLDGSNFRLGSFSNGSKKSEALLPSVNFGLAFSHQLEKHVKCSESMQNSINMRFNFVPVGCSSGKQVFQSTKIAGKNELEDFDRGLPWLKEQVSEGRSVEEGKELTPVESVLSEIHSEFLHKLMLEEAEGKSVPSKLLRSTPETEDFGQVKEDGASDENSSKCPVLDSEKQIPYNLKVEEERLARKCKSFVDQIDLNLCINEDEGLLEDINLQAPVSPETKECSPPRAESDENQIETPNKLPRPEDPEQEEQVRVTADALISLSAFWTQNWSNNQNFMSPSSNYLYWFAGIVSSLGNDPACESKVLLDGTNDNLEDPHPDEIDYFEAMTLKLKDTKVQEGCCKLDGPKEEEATCTTPTQPRKGRTRRGRRPKDFQGEILPSLASLSRYEVTEDLQTIGELMEAAGTCLETGSMKSSDRYGLARGKRRSCFSSFQNKDDTVDFQLQQLTSKSVLGNEQRGLISWGKVTRKRRGQRYPAGNPQIIFS